MKKYQYKMLGKATVNNLITSQDTDDFINRMSEPAPRNKSRKRTAIEHYVARTGKVFTGGYGLINPPKLNICNDTLNKLKGAVNNYE